MGAIRYITSDPTGAQIANAARQSEIDAGREEEDFRQRYQFEQGIKSQDALNQAINAYQTKFAPPSVAPSAPVAPAQPQMAPMPQVSAPDPTATMPAAPINSVVSRGPTSADLINALGTDKSTAAMRFNLLQQQAKGNDDAAEKAQHTVIELWKTGTPEAIEMSRTLNARYGLGLPDQAFADAKVRWNTIGQYEVMAQKFGTENLSGVITNMKTGDWSKPFPGKPSIHDTSEGVMQIDRNGATPVMSNGKRVMPFRRGSGDGSGDGGDTSAIRTMKWKQQQYVNAGVEPKLAGSIAANPAFAMTPQAVMKQAQFIIESSTDLSGRVTKTNDQAMAEARQMMQAAQQAAFEGMGAPAQQPAPAMAPAPARNRIRFDSQGNIIQQ